MRNRSRTLLFPLSLCMGLLIVFQQPLCAAEQSATVATDSYKVLQGSWQRTDGSYSIKVSAIQNDGRVDAEYFNPRPIHIAKATVSTQKGLTRLLVQLQDKGYEGSTYTLYYYAEKDALAGFYYQAVLDRTYKVIFLRKNT